MKRRTKEWIAGRAVHALLVVLLAAGAARADQVTSKGTVLKGKITSVSSAGITFEPEYGKGSLTIKWEDIEDLKSDGNFQVLYGEDEESLLPLQGFSNGILFIGAGLEGATQVEVATIHSGYPIGPDGPGWRDRMRSSWRYWDGNFDLAYDLQRATIDTNGLLIGFKTTRIKNPNRLTLAATYRYATQTQKEQVQPPPAAKQEKTTTTQDQLYGLIRDEHDLIPRLYVFGSGEATYDAVQKLSIRGIPKAGLGYLFWEEKLDEDTRNYFSGDVGGAWVYEKFFPVDSVTPGCPNPPCTDENNFFAIAFGAALGYHLPYGATLDGLASFLPAVDNFTSDYIARGELYLTMPLVDPIAAKFSVVDVYDSTPAPDTKGNSLFLNFGFSLVW